MAHSSAYALWITAAGQSEIRHETIESGAENTALVRTLYTGISRGTESLIYNGRVPVSEYTRMRAPFQEGAFPFPVKYGYSNVGIVEDGPKQWLGKNVFCLYPHQTHYAVPTSALSLVPEAVPANRAVLGANMETAVNALWDAEPSIGDKVTVIGAGVVGSLIAWLVAQIPGTDVELVDINSDRASLAKKLNLNFCLPEHASTHRDLIIHTSATEQGLHTALNCAGFEATVLEVSWYGNQNISLPLGGSFHSQRLRILSSQVGLIATSQRARWNYKRRLTLALSLLTDHRLDHLISSQSHFSELPQTLSDVTRPTSNTLCHRISYD